MTINGLYVIVDTTFMPEKSHTELSQQILDGGGKIIQLRMKGLSSSEELNRAWRAADSIMALKKSYDFTFIVNDYVDIAKAVGADGVHVGENDWPLDAVRRAFKGAVIGYSAHTIEEAEEAAKNGADYVAFGAIFPTPTKGPGHPVQGIKKLRKFVGSVTIPKVAIGGITRQNIGAVIGTGVDAIAMITAITKAADITAETRWFVEKIG